MPFPRQIYTICQLIWKYSNIFDWCVHMYYVCMLHSIFDEKFLYCEFLSEKIGFFHSGWIHFQACTIRCYVNLTVLTCIQTQICDPENDLEIVHVGINQFCENICRFYLRKLQNAYAVLYVSDWRNLIKYY